MEIIAKGIFNNLNKICEIYLKPSLCLLMWIKCMQFYYGSWTFLRQNNNCIRGCTHSERMPHAAQDTSWGEKKKNKQRKQDRMKKKRSSHIGIDDMQSNGSYLVWCFTGAIPTGELVSVAQSSFLSLRAHWFGFRCHIPLK